MNYRIRFPFLITAAAALLAACAPAHGPTVSTGGAGKVYHNVGARGEDRQTDASKVEVAVSSADAPAPNDRKDYDAWDDPKSKDRADLKKDLAAGRHPDPKNRAYGGWKSSLKSR